MRVEARLGTAPSHLDRVSNCGVWASPAPPGIVARSARAFTRRGGRVLDAGRYRAGVALLEAGPCRQGSRVLDVSLCWVGRPCVPQVHTAVSEAVTWTHVPLNSTNGDASASAFVTRLGRPQNGRCLYEPGGHRQLHRKEAQGAKPDAGAAGRAARHLKQDGFQVGERQVHAGLRYHPGALRRAPCDASGALGRRGRGARQCAGLRR